MNRIKIVDWANGNTDSFNYYLDGELQQANLGNFGHNITYNLDKAGNRTSVVDNNVPSTYSPNPINQYTTGAGNTVVNGPEHEISDYQAVHYTYINDERLRSAATGTTTYSMVYDALGRCVKRTLSSGPTTYYLYDGEKPILEYDASGTPVGINVYGKGIDEILERVAIGSDNQSHVYFLQQNHEGSVTLLTDSTGSVVERYRYDAYGAPTIYSGNWTQLSNTAYNNRFLFTGREYAATYRNTYVPEFTFYEYRARAYNPTLGRFMSEDPKLFDAGDYNLFRYCHNDPVDFTDPMGTDEAAPKHSPRETSLERAEELSASQAVWQRQMHFDRSNGAVATGWGAFKAVKEFALATDRMTGGREYRALVGKYIRWTENNRAAMPRWLQAFHQFIDDTGGIGLGVPVGGVKTVGQFTKVFRVWGDDAKAWSPSWTPVDPRTVPNYRNAAGLPNQNSGRFLSEGILRNTEGITAREALPLHGGDGGLRELQIPYAEQKVQLQNVQGLNPPF